MRRANTASQQTRPMGGSSVGGSSIQEHSVASLPSRTQGVYSRPQTSQRLVDKNSLIFREFTSGVKRRKRLMSKIEEMAQEEEQSSGMMKRYLLELRSLTLALIEDALEIEYRSKFTGNLKGRSRGKAPASLPPLAQSNVLEDKDDVYMLAQFLTDTDHLLMMPNVRVFLPYDFPTTRNTFMLGKSVDELAGMQAPIPQKGNLDHELKVLELLRYRRAARALLKAETQALNKLPITLTGLDDIYKRSVEDQDIEVVLRACMTILANDEPPRQGEGAQLGYLNQYLQLMESHVFMNLLNTFQFKMPVRLDVQAAIRSSLAGCNFMRINQDNSVSFLVEWINSALSRAGGVADDGMSEAPSAPVHQMQMGSGSVYGGYPPPGAHAPYDPSAMQMQHVTAQLQPGEAGMVSTLQLRQSMDSMDGDISVLGAPSETGLDVTGAKEEGRHGLEDEDDGSLTFSPIKMIGPNGKPIKKTVNAKLDYAGMKKRRMDAMKDKEGLMSKTTSSKSYGAGYPGGESSVVMSQSMRAGTSGGRDESAALQALRYELLRMQQELLRRQVLDPKHYKAVSVDVTENNDRRRLRSNIAALTSSLNKPKGGDESDKVTETILASKPIKNAAFPITFEVCYEPLHETVVARAVRIHDAQSVLEQPLFSIGDKEILFYYTMSKLTFNRLSEEVLDEILDMPAGRSANPKMRLIYHALKENIMYDEEEECIYPDGQLPIDIDWHLHKDTMVISGCAVELSIDRAPDDTGLFLSVRPASSTVMKNDPGPVTLTVHDSEIQVLLINQRGLYRLARAKWSALVLVAQWLANRLDIRRIYVGDHPSKVAGSSLSQQENGPPRVKEEPTMNLDGSISLLSMTKSDVLVHEGADGDNAQAVVAAGGDIDLSQVVLDMELDRTVDINSAARMQWTSRRTPKIEQVTYSLDAFQDMELLIIRATISMPDEIMRYRKKQETELIDYANIPVFATEDFFEEKSIQKEPPREPITMQLTTRLTGFELGVFGVAKILEDHNVALSNKTTKAPNPSDFMWNIVNRMKLKFSGDRSNPWVGGCSAEDVENWVITYDRRLLRDIRTVSGGVMVLTATAVGNEILFDAEPTNGSIYEKVGSKLMSHQEIVDVVLAEGWPMKLLEAAQRLQLAYRILERLKVVMENDAHRLEFYNYPERRMLMVAISNGVNRPETNAGMVEINDHITLNDLRTLLTHELDKEVLPKLYRFNYKGGTCAVRQEQFRRAWELLPRAVLVPRKPKEDPTDAEKKKAEEAKKAGAGGKGASAENKEKKKEEFELKPEQRRVSARLVPVPVHTLGRVEEETGNIFLLHDSRDHLAAGDIVRVGSVLGRDYIVAGRPKRQQNDYPKLLRIEPEFSMMYEDEFDIPTMGNLAGPKKNVLTEDMQQWYPADHGLEYYDLRVDRRGKVIKADKAQPSWSSVQSLQNRTHTSPPLESSLEESQGQSQQQVQVQQQQQGTGGMAVALGSSLEGAGSVADGSVAGGTSEPQGSNVSGGVTTMPGDRNLLAEVDKATQRSLPAVAPVEKTVIWKDIWLWKCIPPEEDERPRWRQAYDDNDPELAYKFEYQFTPYGEEEAGVTYFRYFAKYSIMEVLCIDSRLPEKARHCQRVDEMELFPVDWYTKKAFDEMKNWFPSHKNAIDMNKWLKMVKDIRVFPDFKKPARMGQCENIFIREMKGENGILERYVNYEGFCRMLQEIALIRFPPELVGEGAFADDLESLAASMATPEGDLAEGSSTTFNGGESVTSSRSGRSGSPTRVGAKRGKTGKKKKDMGKSKRERDREAREKAAEVNNERPTVDPVQAAIAYRRMVTNYIMNIPEWSRMCWKEAKIAAMNREARRFAAASRICAIFRGWRMHRIYVNIHKSMTLMQGHARRRAATRRVKAVLSNLMEDWLFRCRFRAATLFCALVRRYLTRCRHRRIMEKLINDQIKIFRMRRKRKRKLRKKERMSVLYRETKRINGLLILLKIERLDKRNYSKDYSIVIVAYLPITQQTFKFEVPEYELRTLMCLELKVDAVGVGDLIDKRNLGLMIDQRLMAKKSPRPGMKPQVVFSRQALGQKGEKVLTCGRIISGDLFVVSIYESGTEMSAQCYHRLTSKVFACYLTTPALVAWVSSEYRLSCKNEIDRHKEPPLLKPANKSKLYRWVADRILTDTRQRTFRVIFACQRERSQKTAAIRMFQGLWRRALIRKSVPQWLDSIYLKVMASRDPEDGHYFIDRRSGASMWTKPILLRGWELPTQPSYRWDDISYYDDKGNLCSQYVNPLTGAFTHLSMDRAARALQSMVRSYQLKPFRITVDSLDRALRLQRSAYDSYEVAPHKLVNIMNLAFVKHVFEGKEEEARELYLKAIELSDANPLVTRAYAIFLLGTCDPPVAFNRDKAMRLFKDASRRDERIEKFELAYNIVYKYACLRRPRDYKLLLALGVAEFYVYKDKSKAERLMRRAVSIAPFEQRIAENWKNLRDEFPEQRLVVRPARDHKADADGSNAKKLVVHGQKVQERAEWAGWTFVESDPEDLRSHDYWYNPATGESTYDEPVWTDQWDIRHKRSKFEREEDNLEHYYDPFTQDYFQYHVLTNTFT